MRIVGIDCATQDAKVGLALGEVVAGRVTLIDRCLCSPARGAVNVVSEWMHDQSPPGKMLLALDAPLGWPRAIRRLEEHVAGEPLTSDADAMFRRATDRFIAETLGQRSLDVGADRIARTAHAALAFLARLRVATGEAIPLAWSPDFDRRVAAIEVYPAATLVGRRIRSKGYKKRDQLAERSEMVANLEKEIEMRHPSDLMSEPDVLDAAVCVLAGHDFIAGKAIPPVDAETARVEGWIWARARH